MNEVTQKAITKACNLLKAAGASYHIVAANGTKYSHGTVAASPAPEKKKRLGKRARVWAKEGRTYGDLAKHVKPVLDSLKPGDVGKVPYGTFNKNTLCNSVSANAIWMWGSGSVITARHSDGVEVLRVK